MGKRATKSLVILIKRQFTVQDKVEMYDKVGLRIGEVPTSTIATSIVTIQRNRNNISCLIDEIHVVN
jgi:hypothetical protein